MIRSSLNEIAKGGLCLDMIPKAEPQKIPIQVFEESIPNDGKWEIEEGRLLFSS